MIKFIGFSTIALCLATTTVEAQSNDWIFEEVNKLSPAVNSSAEDIMPIVSQDGTTMYFVRGLHEDNTGGKDGGHDIWMSKKGADGSWSSAVNDLPNLNNEENNAVIGIDQSSNNLYLLNAYKKQDVGEDERGIALAENKSGSYGKPSFVKLPAFVTNTPEQTYYVAPEGDLIILAVNSTNTLGGEDLYVTEKKDGNWTAPLHLGNVINSKGFEMSPFLSADRKHLFFASNGFGGLGNADLFVSTRTGDSWTQWSEPKNLGNRVNSSGFDAYLTMTADSTFYFASDRDGSMSDIYSTRFYVEPPVEPVDTVAPDTLPVVVTPPVLTSPNIYFEKDSYALSAEYKKVLDAVAMKMKENPLAKVELTGHADVTFTDEHNQRLSKNRAKSAQRYLTSIGIGSNRITQKAMGESQPVVNCPEADCSDEQHASNRRVEIRFY